MAEPTRTRRVRLIGVGPGDPDLVTVAAVRAMNEVDLLLVADKSSEGAASAEDPLVAVRERILAAHLDHEPVLVRVADPPRERRTSRTGSVADYRAAVAGWHAARAEAFAAALRARPGEAGVLVWGDPALYDSTVRVVEAAAEILAREDPGTGLVIDVVPGVSSLSLLAARHAIVLHEVGEPVHVTTGRRLGEALEAGQRNIAVMLNARVDADTLAGLESWSIWWGANLGGAGEELLAGTVREVVEDIVAARARAREAAGWVMDAFLLRAPAGG